MNNFTQKIITTFLGLIFLSSPCLSLAITSDFSGIMPAYPDPANPLTKSRFIYDLKVGESKEDAIKVMNNSNEYATFKIYPADALTTTEGNFSLANEAEPKTDIGAWIKLSSDQVTIPPHKEILVAFVITIPDEAEAGDHIGGLIVEQVNADEDEQKKLFIKTRFGVRIYETVPGEIIKKLTIKEFSWQLFKKPIKAETSLNRSDKIIYFIKNKIKSILGLDNYLVFFIKMGNEGNVHLEPKGNLVIKNVLGGEIARLESEINTILPHQEINYPIKWERKMPFFGRYTATVEVKYGDEGSAPATSQKLIIWAIPRLLLTTAMILIVVIILLRLTLLLIIETHKKKITASSPAKAAKNELGKKPINKKQFHVILGGIITAAIIIIAGLIVIDCQKPKISTDAGPTPQKIKEPTAAKKIGDSAKEITDDQLARDHQRKMDLKIIKSALLKYYQTERQYPISQKMIILDQNGLLQKELVDKNYLEKLPQDPLAGQKLSYYYGYQSTDGKTFELSCLLENPNDTDGKKLGEYLIYNLKP